jgi:DmsE family decaheme c-type cytochrome
MRRVLLVAALVAAGALLGGGPAFAQAAAAPAAAAPVAINATECLGCHDTAGTASFTHTRHATLTESCGACHPKAAEHAKAQAAGESGGPVPSLKKLKAHELNAVCLTCHEKAGQANWASSMHDRRNVACTDCHGIHEYKSIRGQLKTQLDPETCAACHKPERSKLMRNSHHPVREGKMSCASCHNPHDGARPKMLKADSVNELCYKCHAEKRGPFLFEHAPVREDCAECHDPHGSNHKRLLVQKLPNLCWNCHLTGSGHFGSGDNLSTELGARIAPAGAPSGYPTANSRFVEKSCKNCHVNLHGSNSPSGAYFIR